MILKKESLNLFTVDLNFAKEKEKNLKMLESAHVLLQGAEKFDLYFIQKEQKKTSQPLIELIDSLFQCVIGTEYMLLKGNKFVSDNFFAISR